MHRQASQTQAGTCIEDPQSVAPVQGAIAVGRTLGGDHLQSTHEVTRCVAEVEGQNDIRGRPEPRRFHRLRRPQALSFAERRDAVSIEGPVLTRGLGPRIPEASQWAKQCR